MGMKHALDADHVAAVTSLATSGRSIRETIRFGMVWGLGHALALFGIGTFVLVSGSLLAENLAQGLELAVGVMLVILGVDVIRRVIRDRVHFHIHRHGSHTHFHAHSHAGEANHAVSSHDHTHTEGMPLRALVVGMVHGMAGSAALVLLTLGTIKSLWMGVFYMAIFGMGSIAGMGFLSFAIALPLHYTARHLTWAYNGVAAIAGLVTVCLGAMLVYQNRIG